MNDCLICKIREWSPSCHSKACNKCGTVTPEQACPMARENVAAGDCQWVAGGLAGLSEGSVSLKWTKDHQSWPGVTSSAVDQGTTKWAISNSDDFKDSCLFWKYLFGSNTFIYEPTSGVREQVS